ncbi:hypothetical protein HK100_006833 [Physocladia obscura]|uniref:Translation initiation factor IF2/IF5 domain-containing protein n=1 Tax=Physocladia obscura TaxID=109957 RepID=A0AAD5T5A3_9FUNG|nr:hypothetical protein HK100_006833 [Physocladia obscura]
MTVPKHEAEMRTLLMAACLSKTWSEEAVRIIWHDFEVLCHGFRSELSFDLLLGNSYAVNSDNGSTDSLMQHQHGDHDGQTERLNENCPVFLGNENYNCTSGSVRQSFYPYESFVRSLTLEIAFPSLDDNLRCAILLARLNGLKIALSNRQKFMGLKTCRVLLSWFPNSINGDAAVDGGGDGDDGDGLKKRRNKNRKPKEKKEKAFKIFAVAEVEAEATAAELMSEPVEETAAVESIPDPVPAQPNPSLPVFDDGPAVVPVADETAEDLFALLKKKKKKKATFDFDAVEPSAESAPSESAPSAEDSATPKDFPVAEVEVEAIGVATSANNDGLDFLEKKKKKKKRPDLAEFEEMMRQEGGDSTNDSFALGGGLDGTVDTSDAVDGDEKDGTAGLPSAVAGGEDAWLGSNRDYTYPELLSRVFKIIRQNNPDLVGEKKKYTLVPPQVVREGTKKSAFVNVVDIARRMRREPEHLIQYLFSELGTTGSIDGAQRLVMKGRFQQKHIENVLKRYIVEYVTCKTCRSGDTILTKENRLFFLQCQSCGSTKSVAAIKTGFMAQTTKRSAMRNAAA